MLTVYCIPGMGVDHRLFRNINLTNCVLKPIKWETPSKNELLPDYAMRLAKQIDTSEPFALLGVSFGGMCVTEIAKRLNPVKAFVISSCKEHKELPIKLNIWKYLPLYKTLNDATYKRSAMFVKKQFGVYTDEQARKFREMLDTSPTNYFKGAVYCIMTWKNKTIPDNLVHIHGTADRVIDVGKINADYLIQEGSHFMVINKADEINKIINRELKDLV